MDTFNHIIQRIKNSVRHNVKQQRCYIAAHQRGFGALEMLIVLAISTLLIASGASVYMRHLDRQANLVTGEHMNLVAEAAASYIKDHYAAVLAVATPTVPAVITIAMLRNTGHLPVGFADANAYGQEYSVLALESRPDELETLIVTQNGEVIRDIYLIEIAKQMGAQGGYITSSNTAVATGSFGGWSTALAPYGVSPGAGHLANALFFKHGALVNDYLYRNAIPGQPHLNQMNTAIDMGGHNLNNAAAVNSQSVNANTANISGTANSGTTDTQGETYTGGWFRSKGDNGWYNEKWNGGWYMNDPGWVRSYSDKSIYTGGTIVGGSVQSQGRAVFGEFLQVEGIAAEGAGCSPNGLIGRTSEGMALSCQSGVWRGSGNISGQYLYIGSFTGTVNLSTGNRALLVQVTGGSSTACGGEGPNRYHIQASVGGLDVAGTSNANHAYSKTGYISFGVPANSAYTISSYPHACPGGVFRVVAFVL